MKQLAVIIVNFNSTDYLARCLDSLALQTRQPHCVTVVDNASQNQDFSHIRTHHPQVDFKLNSENVGFATACNQGIAGTEAEFYLLLNPDTEILDGAVDKTLSFLQQNSQIGIAGCRVENPDGTLQRAARRSIPRPATAFYRLSGLERLFPRSRHLGRYNLSHLDEKTSHPVEAVSGSFLMFRRPLLAQIGPLDERFFLYGEDLDFCYRGVLAGWEVYFFAGARVLHHKRRSSSQSPRASTYHFYNAMKVFYRKHFAPESNRVKNWAVLAAIEGLYRAQRMRQLLTGSREVGSDA